MKYGIEIKQKAIEYYLMGYSAKKIESILKVNEVTIRKWLKDNNIIIRNGGSYNVKHSEEIVERILKLYKQGINTSEISKILDLKRGVALSILKRNGVKLNHRGPKSKIGKEDYFDIIDCSEKAYFLGWLMADGNISITNGQYSIKVHIAYKDKEIIDNFLYHIESTNKTKLKNGDNPSYYVSLTSRHMCESLMKYGIIPNKTGKEHIPKNIPYMYIRDFIRGIFDGDGITDVSKCRSGFVGSNNLVNSILKEINENLRVFKTKSDGIYYFLGGKKFSRRLFQYMYEDSSLYLIRKYERMKYICNN